MLAPLLDEVESRLPAGLETAFAALRSTLDRAPSAAVEHVWQHRLLLELPRLVDEHAVSSGPNAEYDAYREAHGLGWLHGWRSDADAHPQASRLRTHLFDRWRDALRAVVPSGTRLNDQISQSVRWMRWGQRSRAAAAAQRRWTLSGYYRSVRWEARTRALASECHLQRVRPGQVAAFARTFDLVTVGLHQLHDAAATPRRSLPALLECSPYALAESGLSALELAGIEAQALGWQRFAGYCRAAVREHRGRPTGPKGKPS